MSESFSVGEVAILQNCTIPSENGMEVEIVDLPKLAHWFAADGLRIRAGYYRILANYDASRKTHYWQCTHDQLRKKRPPPTREQTSTWDDLIVWRPKETANV